MNPNSPRWITVSDSQFDHEREALAFLRQALPDADPVRVWSNFEFTASDGTLSEVDALALTSAGLFLIEIKSHPGAIRGDAAAWRWTRPDGDVRDFDNPRILANRKAKRLATMLAHSDVIRNARKRAPWVQEVVFLSDPELVVGLTPSGGASVYGRDAPDGQEIPRERRSIGGIIEGITSLDLTTTGTPRRRIDRPTGELIVRAMDEIGIRERSSRRQIGDYVIGRLLADVEADPSTGITYQDYAATHVALDGVERRIRVYPLERNATKETREAAERAARREFTHLHPLDHPGILRPIDYTDSERGPALVFDFDADEQSLNTWIEREDVKGSLTVTDRLAVTRLIAEALHSAHQRGVTHRSLGPSAILVSGPPGAPSVRIANWHAGARVATGTASPTTTAATAHLEALSPHDAVFYRAPEATQPNPSSRLLDVFGLGALATLIFTDRSPAETLNAYSQMLVETGFIPADVVGDGVDQDVCDLIAEATAADPGARLDSVADFLAGLDLIEEEWQRSEEAPGPAPDAARRGDILGSGRFEVLHRLGSGSTAIALEVADNNNDRRTAVLKVASDPTHNGRIEDEARAISQLVQRNIVRLLDGPLDLGGHSALLLSHAGSTTLASRMADRPLAELAQRFGEDLLEAVRHLEQHGVSHRDIKPENIGVTKMGANDELHLVLFDFSLANAPIDQIAAGTQGYIDPFLRLPGRMSWDLAAERYSAAVTLFEMLTGARPTYGDGSADPAMTDDQLAIDRSLFEPALAGGLVRFFERALNRDVAARFDTADGMLRAWQEAFEPASEPATTVHPSPGDEPSGGLVLPPGVSRATPLAGLPISNRAINALEAEEVITVGDLLVFPLNRVPQLRGVGAQTRREITSAAAELKRQLPADGTQDADVDVENASLKAMSDRLIPRNSGASATRDSVLEGLLDRDGAHPVWPAQSELARDAGVTPGRVAQLIGDARSRWERQPALTSVRDWLTRELQTNGGIATFEQLEARLADSRPDSATTRIDQLAAARAVLRAAVIAEGSRELPRWSVRRRGGATLLASEFADPDRPTGQQLADYASALAERVELLVAEHEVVRRQELLDSLASVEPPQGGIPVPEAHLVDVATGLTPDASVNARLEVYRVGLPAERALAHTRRAFAAVHQITPDDVASKVRARFPYAESLPGRPQLDELLEAVGLALSWDSSANAYVAPQTEVTGTSAETTFKRHATGVPTDLTPVEVDHAADFQRRLEKSVNTGGVLVLVTEPARLEDAASQLGNLPVSLVDFDAMLIAQLAELTATGKPSWELVMAADAAGPGTAEWINLTKLIDRALVNVTEHLRTQLGTVALHRVGLLSRYNRLNLVSEWRDILHSGSAELAGLWLIVGTPQTSAMPTVDGKAVPVIGPNEWARIPREWLENAHRAGVVL